MGTQPDASPAARFRDSGGPLSPFRRGLEPQNYDQRVPVEGGAFLAWGHLTYTKPLTEKQAADYELRPAPEVAGLLRDSSRPRPIAEQMAEAQKLADKQRGEIGPVQEERGDR